MEGLGLSTSYVQQDTLHATGTAKVAIDQAGQPSFTIQEPVAWDFLEWTTQWEDLSTKADVVCFGSLAQRSEKSASTIEHFLKKTPKNTIRICDVNLREPYYNQAVLRSSFQYADIVKLNDQELLQVSHLFDLGIGTDEMLAKRLLRLCDLRLVCITRGSLGSLLITQNEVRQFYDETHVPILYLESAMFRRPTGSRPPSFADFSKMLYGAYIG